MTFWSAAPLDNYVCVACGYVESYVGDATKLQKIVENWPRVQPGSLFAHIVFVAP
jgi:hypothetical protein